MIQLWQSVLSVVITGVILAVIKRQLDWRGTFGKPVPGSEGHVEASEV